MTSNSEPLLLGAVGYDPKVITIWDGFKLWFEQNGLAFDYILYSNYERQVEAQLAGQVHVAWRSPSSPGVGSRWAPRTRPRRP